MCQFLKNWQFNDYAKLLHLETGQGLPGNTTWQSFEVLLLLSDFAVSGIWRWRGGGIRVLALWLQTPKLSKDDSNEPTP